MVISAAEQPLAELRVGASQAQADELLAWAAAWPERTWAVEGARGLGRLLAQQLVAGSRNVFRQSRQVQFDALADAVGSSLDTCVEHRIYADRVAPGFAYAAGGVILSAAPLFVAARLTRANPAGRTAITTASAWAAIASRSLYEAARQIETALGTCDLQRARELLP